MGCHCLLQQHTLGVIISHDKLRQCDKKENTYNVNDQISEKKKGRAKMKEEEEGMVPAETEAAGGGGGEEKEEMEHLHLLHGYRAPGKLKVPK